MIQTILQNSWKAFFDPQKEKDYSILTWIWLGFLLLLGLLVWGYFLNFGSIPFDYHDWAEINAPRIAFLKDAVTKGLLPLHMPDASALRGFTDRFMALPDVILSPQIILLRWLSVGDFVLVHTWLLYAIGFLGLFVLKQHLQLSLFSFTWLFFLFNFNGHILSHYSVGHVTWGGYFLFPWFIWLIFCLLGGEKDWTWVTRMAVLLFVIFLQGSFHQFVWCLIFLGILAVTKPKKFVTILKAGIFACLLSAVRIIPPALQMNTFDNEFLGGYRSPQQLIKAFIQILTPVEAVDPKITGAALGWWEYDTYIGLAGVCFLGFFGILWLKNHKKEFGYPALILPLLILSVFSVRDFYLIIRSTQIPLFSGERVSTRFLIIPVLFLIIFACTALQDRLRERNFNLLDITFSSVFLLILLAELWSHLETWKVMNSVHAFPYTYTDLAIKTVSNHPDPVYTNGLLAGLAITTLSAITLFLFVLKENKLRNKKTDGTASS